MVLKVTNQLDERTCTRLLCSPEISDRSAQARVLQSIQRLLTGLERLLENRHQLVLRGRVRDYRPRARAVPREHAAHTKVRLDDMRDDLPVRPLIRSRMISVLVRRHLLGCSDHIAGLALKDFLRTRRYRIRDILRKRTSRSRRQYHPTHCNLHRVTSDSSYLLSG